MVADYGRFKEAVADFYAEAYELLEGIDNSLIPYIDADKFWERLTECYPKMRPNELAYASWYLSVGSATLSCKL